MQMKKQQLELDMELYGVTESRTRQKLNWTELNFVQLDHGESKEIPEKKTKQNKTKTTSASLTTLKPLTV